MPGGQHGGPEPGQVSLGMVLTHIQFQVSHPARVVFVKGQRRGAQGVPYLPDDLLGRARDRGPHSQAQDLAGPSVRVPSVDEGRGTGERGLRRVQRGIDDADVQGGEVASPGGGGTQRLPRLVGKGRALQLILSGEMINAAEAYRIGLVNEVVPAADLIACAEALLKQILTNAPIAVRYSLEAVNKGLETSQAEGLALEASFFGICAATEDKKEGTSAFLEKRAAQFQGR